MNHMTPDRFGELLDLHGSDLARWPSVEGAEAAVLVQLDPRARAMFDGARRLERAFAATRPEAASATLQRRILEALPRHERSLPPAAVPIWKLLGDLIGGWRIAGPAFVTSLALGIALGYGVTDLPGPDLFDVAGFNDFEIEY